MIRLQSGYITLLVIYISYVRVECDGAAAKWASHLQLLEPSRLLPARYIATVRPNSPSTECPTNARRFASTGHRQIAAAEPACDGRPGARAASRVSLFDGADPRADRGPAAGRRGNDLERGGTVQYRAVAS